MKTCLPGLDKRREAFGQPWDVSVLLTSDSIRVPNLGWIMFICWLAGCFLLLCLLLVLEKKLEVVLLGFSLALTSFLAWFFLNVLQKTARRLLQV